MIFALWQVLYPMGCTDLVWINRTHNKWNEKLFDMFHILRIYYICTVY